MAVQWPLVVHGVVTLLVVVSFLCGRWPIFRGTFVEKIHYFITYGAYDYFLHFLICLYGALVLGLILAGQLKEHKIIYILTAYYGIEHSFSSLSPHVVQTFKWQDYISWKRKLNEAKASAAALKAGIQTINEEAKAPESKWRGFFRRSPPQNDDVIVKNNLYDQGLISNICEIIFPLSERKSFFHRKST
ncbi:hypothetical protein C4D60_Mb03t08870 [Musa balbisiana]|uniref:Uncharacterized protein n=1 Tax=Musa balbisiana TaxID=52838 RepID=A0A4S8J8I7_MUSBA|nr:hypothetical protein C4D60_Mb03t08870 [Musa balbisiana]